MAKNETRNSASSLNDEQKKQLAKVVDAVAAQYLRIQDERDALKNIVETAAEDLNLDPKMITKAGAAVYRQNFADTTDAVDEISTILSVTGNLSIATSK